MRCLIVPSVARSLPARWRTRAAAASWRSSTSAVASTMPAASASSAPKRCPVVIASTAARGVSFDMTSAFMPGVKGMRMSTSGKQT